MGPSRIVVKAGSSSVTDSEGRPSERGLDSLVAQLAALDPDRVRPVLVSSGAIACGRAVVSPTRFRDVGDMQALAAVGQGLLMERYARLFAARDRQVGQVLLTAREVADRPSYLNARRTLERLLEWSVIPVVNENDTTATEEITLGDNDRLAALIAAMLHAELLLVLTDTAGLYTADPRLSAEASLIEEVASIDAALESATATPGSALGRGGMASKVAAARIASWSGVPCVIASAHEPDVIARAVAGESVGTRIRLRTPPLPARKVWIAFALPPRGRLVVDAGAAGALRTGGRSLLPVGIRALQGDFEERDAVEIVSETGALIAKGLAALSATALAPMIVPSTPRDRGPGTAQGNGTASGAPPASRPTVRRPRGTPTVEAVHRDDLVVL